MREGLRKRRPAWRRLVRRVFHAGLRTWSRFETIGGGSPTELLPPVHLRYYYYRTWRPEAFQRAARAAALELTSRGLQPDHRLLDIGSGIGNLPLGLRDFLQGGYDGLEIHGEAVAWCQRAITPRFPAMRFHRADVYSRAYNPAGTAPASSYRFPFEDERFDFVFLGSVFTHMLPDEVGHYLSEIARVLKPGGVAVESFFLLNAETLPGVESGGSFMSFPVIRDRYRLHDPGVPEAAVALDEAFVTSEHERHDLAITDVRRGGWWRGVADQQDVITAVKGRGSG